ncbi:MAG: prepilin-type N-terminal cleavage/methylation domain-containing protein [Candidatus Omnitrophica bacterium]|nr:prepilin-type N-terminal cleavage/methylation domain-containing protein [Candidatus Omnitrophota bacterium]
MTSRTGKNKARRAFTLIEVMVAVAVLSFGIVMIYQAYFTVANAYSYCSRYLAIAPSVEEKIWEAQDSIRRTGDLVDQPLEGQWQVGAKNYVWLLSYLPLESDPESGLFKITLEVNWKEGKRYVKTGRTAYAFYQKAE